jgi:nitrite reductase/ring-hydroxylating ferredoxin subunit
VPLAAKLHFIIYISVLIPLILGPVLDSGFVYAAKTSEIPAGETKKLPLGDFGVLIANVEGAFYAVDALCTHYGGDLSAGKLEGKILTCPVHGAKFDITNGKVYSPPTEPLDRPEIENLITHPLKIMNGEIYIKIS